MPGTMSGSDQPAAWKPGRGVFAPAIAPSIAIAVMALVMAGCSSQARHSAKPKPKEYFAESEYGVKASPRVTNKRSRLPRGGGRELVGKSYRIKDTWYHPKEVTSYTKVGKASWYGDAFHGRLTANGEVYDMTHLTAAHPTLPLPSYARVTNLKNNHSVIVRVNDRGPFHGNRIIDLSRRAAEMLDYTRAGVADVKVEYIGRAPLHGQDDEFLLASFVPGGDPAPADSVLVAMNGPTPERMGRHVPNIIADGGGTADLPEYGPILSENPLSAGSLALRARMGLEVAYAGVSAPGKAGAALEKLVAGGLTTDAILASWNRQSASAPEVSTIHLGTYQDASAAHALADKLRGHGNVGIERADGDSAYTVTMRIDTGAETELLRKAWSLGASDAFIVRP